MANKTAHEAACESLLSEIASRAQRTQEIMRQVDFGSHDEVIRQVEMLENMVYQMGWLADAALTNMGSIFRVHDGDAVKWMTSPITISALGKEVQHG